LAAAANKSSSSLSSVASATGASTLLEAWSCSSVKTPLIKSSQALSASPFDSLKAAVACCSLYPNSMMICLDCANAGSSGCSSAG